jgi:methylenetetrahydrofolate dehydrogenase (NADP+)/methenyltetrahydrofolate cyclohydrolase
MKILSGSELAGFIKQRQAQQVARLVGQNIHPRLAIIQTIDDEVINTYVRLKVAYGDDIGVAVDKHFLSPEEILPKIDELNKDPSIHGIIIQLPLADGIDRQVVLNAVDRHKDVDGLANESMFDPATPVAILWLLSGYNIDLRGKQIVVVGQGLLVGAPLIRMLTNSGFIVRAVDESTKDLAHIVSGADVVITATGSPSLINSSMIAENSVVVDAGVAVESGKKVGDLSDDVYDRDDLKLTPKIGGVGPLTVCALFDNVIKAADSKL